MRAVDAFMIAFLRVSFEWYNNSDQLGAIG